MRVLATTVHRTSKNTESHGFLLEIDWHQKKILKQIEAPALWSHFNWRNRGGRRGLRGITFYNGLIWAASCEVVFGLHPETLELERLISHPYMAHIHEILGCNDGIWITSTGGAGVFLIDEHQQVHQQAWLRGKPSEDLRVKLDFKEQYHVNSVSVFNGEVFMYAAKTGEVFRVSPQAQPIDVVARLEKGCHNVIRTTYGWVRNHSPKSKLIIGEREVALPKKGKKEEFTAPGWLRGMAWVSDTRVIIGSTPATLYEVDLETLEIVSHMKLEDDVNWTIAGIYIDGGC